MCHSWGATARAHVQGNDVPDLENGWTDCAQIWYTVRDRLVGGLHKLIGVTRAQFRTCKAQYLARSVGRPKRRYTGFIFTMSAVDIDIHINIKFFVWMSKGPLTIYAFLLKKNDKPFLCDMISKNRIFHFWRVN